MKKTMTNNVHLEGLLYDHALERKVTGETSKHPGTTYISGNISIATDVEGINICKVYFTYVTPTTAKGNPNATYNVLNDIIDGKVETEINGTVGATPTYIKVDSALALNEWYDNDNNLVSTMRAEGGFVHLIKEKDIVDEMRNLIEADMLITNFKRIEADPENDTPEHGEVRGAIFNFRKEVLPVSFKVYNPDGLNYFEDSDISSTNPMFAKMFGTQKSTTIATEKVEETAFGESIVKPTVKSRKEFILTTVKPPYDWDTEETLTAVELKELMAQRELKLAEIKARKEEYVKTKNGATQEKVSIAGFDF